MLTTILILTAVAVFIFPAVAIKNLKLPIPAVRQKPKPDFQEGMKAIALVQNRVIETGDLEDDEKSAIDTLTLALVRGSCHE
jgi:hypothetical protein